MIKNPQEDINSWLLRYKFSKMVLLNVVELDGLLQGTPNRTQGNVHSIKFKL